MIVAAACGFLKITLQPPNRNTRSRIDRGAVFVDRPFLTKRVGEKRARYSPSSACHESCGSRAAATWSIRLAAVRFGAASSASSESA